MVEMQKLKEFVDLTTTLSFQRDMGEALRWSLRACDLDSYEGCANASVMFRKGEGSHKDLRRSAELAEKANELHKQEQGKQPTLSFGGT